MSGSMLDAESSELPDAGGLGWPDASMAPGPDTGILPGAGNSVTTAIVFPTEVSGSVTIRVTVYDPESHPVDLEAEYSLDGGRTWSRATVPADMLIGLPSSFEGVESVFSWDSLDLGFRNRELALFKVTPWDAGRPGLSSTVSVPPRDNLRVAARRVERPMVHYGSFEPQVISTAQKHDLVIIHPWAGYVTPENIRTIQDGVDPDDPRDDVIVLCYLSIGEDLRTVHKTAEEMARDPRFVGDGTGPRRDPRGPNADGEPLFGIDPLGLPSNGGTGYASWYLDDNSIDRAANGIGDGKPDRNSIFGGCFVNAGDPEWFDTLDEMRFDSDDGVPGIRELLTPFYGRGYACDGLFLDTVDTAAPNSYTDGNSLNQSEYEWTGPGFRDFIKRLRETYPRAVLLQNRGFFYFDPSGLHYQITTRPYIDLVLFESYRLNSSEFEQWNEYYFPDNKYNVVPKLMAEANRPDGFRVVSLGYAEGPAGTMDPATLVAESDLGFDSLLEDIHQAQKLAGFRHYLTNAEIDLANTFVLDYADTTDTAPPTWTSVYNRNNHHGRIVPTAPDPRPGIREVVPGFKSLTVHWDVALDFNRVGYALYLSEQPFDFTTDPDLSTAIRTVLRPAIGHRYGTGFGPHVFPYQATVTGLVGGATYYLCIRAFDSAGNEEKNQITLSATTLEPAKITIDGEFADWVDVPLIYQDATDTADSSGPDWGQIKLTSDSESLYIYFTSRNPFNLDGSPSYLFSRTIIFIDIDEDINTGYHYIDVGSDRMIFGRSLFTQKSRDFSTELIDLIDFAPTTDLTRAELEIPLDYLSYCRYEQKHEPARLRLLFLNDETFDRAPDSRYIEYRVPGRNDPLHTSTSPCNSTTAP
ncbi:MAG: hypothetical protein MJE77_05095 [Proteobacteria bacterium]|nr:hypothetical protein [Pseudomonadota bacterium]